jgi:hypothetical protein
MSELEKIKRELKAARLMRLIEKDMMEDNFTMCREAAFFWKGKAEAVEKENAALRKQAENLSQKVTEFDKVIREVCTELHLCYGGVDFDEGEIVQAVIALKATVGSLKEQLTLNNIEYLKTKEEVDVETK